jgi:16S rRNA (guanine(966)-N(2))-methyltransferase RsmD
VRVIAGTAKAIQLQAVPGTGTRPIADRVKEALFGILGERIAGARVLDLFAGTGSVGIEALSRGAAEAVFVDSQPKAVATIRTNLQRTSLQTCARAVKADVFRFLASRPEPFDLVYIAPPQYLDLWKKALLTLDAAPGWLGADGVVVVQLFPKEFEPLELVRLQPVEQRRYGSTLLCFYEPSP